MLGVPDLYCHQGYQALDICTDHSGGVTCMLSLKNTQISSPSNESRDKKNVVKPLCTDTATYCVSIWLHLYGMVRVGEMHIDIAQSLQKVVLTHDLPLISHDQNIDSAESNFHEKDTEEDDLQGTYAILWHPRGKRLCVVIQGRAHIITLSWRDIHHSQPALLASAFTMSAVDSDASPTCHVKASLAMTCQMPTKLVIMSVALAAGKQVFYGILQDGRIARISWHGICQGFVALPLVSMPTPAFEVPPSTSVSTINFQAVELSSSRALYEQEDEEDRDRESISSQKQVEDKENESEPGDISGMPAEPGQIEQTTAQAATFIGFSSRLRSSVFVTSDGALSFICAETCKNGHGLAISPQLHLKLTKQSAQVLLQSCLVETDDETLLVCLVRQVGNGDQNDLNRINNQHVFMITYQLESSLSTIEDSNLFISIQMCSRSAVDLESPQNRTEAGSERGKSTHDARPVLIPYVQYEQLCVFLLHEGQISCHVCSQLNSCPLFRCKVEHAQGVSLAVDKLMLWYNNEKGAVILATPLIRSIAAGGRACARSGGYYSLDSLHGTLLKYEPATPAVNLEVTNTHGNGILGADIYSDPIASTGAWSALILPRALRSQLFTNGMQEPPSTSTSTPPAQTTVSSSGNMAEVSSSSRVFNGRYSGYSGTEIICEHSDNTPLSAGARPGLYGAGYVVTACTATAVTSISSETGAILWIYGERTLKWRSSSFVIDDKSNAQAYIYKPTQPNMPENVSQLPFRQYSSLQHTPILQQGPAIDVVRGPLVRILAVHWIGDHTLVLLTTRYRAQVKTKDGKLGGRSTADNAQNTASRNSYDSAFVRCVEVVSRAVTTTSLRRGVPQPEVHVLVVLLPEAQRTAALLDVVPCTIQSPKEQTVHVLVNDGVSGNRLLALELIVKQSISHTSSASSIARAGASHGMPVDLPPSYLLRAMWVISPPHNQGFEKAALFRSKISANTDSEAEVGLSVVLLDKSGIVHFANANFVSKGTYSDADADKDDMECPASLWQAFPDAMIDMCVVDRKHFISDDAPDASAPNRYTNKNINQGSERKKEGCNYPSMSVVPLLGERNSPSALIMSPKNSGNSLFPSSNSNSAVIWLPVAREVEIPHLLSLSHGGILVHLPETASAGHALQPLGMCVHQGMLLNCTQKGSLCPFLNTASNSNDGSAARQQGYGYRGSFARAVLAGLPAGVLNVTSTPIAATILLLLARCRTASAVAIGKSVLHALYRNPCSIAATADVLEDVLLELLRRKESNSKGREQQASKIHGNGANISSRNSSTSAVTSRAVALRSGPGIDAESPTVAAITAIASWPERLFGFVANKPPVLPHSQRTLSSSSNVNSTLYDGRLQVQVDPLAGLSYVMMLQFIFAIDPLLFFELTSHLGRKVEPETAKGLLPLALQSPYGPAILRSPLSLFEECLQQGLLTYASRYLTLACEYVGGSSSFHSCLECLSMAQELVMALLLRLRLPLAIECLEFCDRLESIIELLVTEESAKRQARRSAREREHSDTTSTNGSGAISAIGSGNLSSTSQPFGERVYRHWLRVSPTLSHYLGGGALWSALSELDEQLHAEQIRGHCASIAKSSTAIVSNATNNVNGSADSGSSGRASKYAVFLAVKNYLGPVRFDDILGLGLKKDTRKPACEGVSFSSALIAMFCEQLLAGKKTYTCGLTLLALLSSEKVRRQIKGHLLGRNGSTASPKTAYASNSTGTGVVSSARRLLQMGKIDEREYTVLMRNVENGNQQGQGQTSEEFQNITNSAEAEIEAQLAILRMEGEHELYAFESSALLFALFVLQSYGFLPSSGPEGVSPENRQVSLGCPKSRLDSNMGYVFLKQQCGLEANAGMRAHNSKPFHDLALPEACFMYGYSEISYSQILRSMILACVMSNKLGSAAILACVAGLPFTAAAIAEMDVETTTVAYALSVVCTVLLDTPCHSLRHDMCTVDTNLLEKAQNAASLDGATPSQTTNLKMLCVGIGLRDACRSVVSANDIAFASYTYFAEHCKHLVV